MLVYRIQRNKYNFQLTGEGAKRFGGRWNSQGVPVVYSSSSASLALLELLVNIGSYSDLESIQFHILTVEIPDACPVENWEISKMPAGWETFPHTYETQMMGDHWVKQGKALALLLPSSVIHSEKNVLINCNHPDFKRVKVVSATPLEHGKRFIKV